MDVGCKFVTKKNKKRCDKPATNDGYCAPHFKYIHRKPRAEASGSEQTASEHTASEQDHEISQPEPESKDDDDLLSIHEFKEELPINKPADTYICDDPYDNDRVIVYRYIDSYFEDHYKRCKYLESLNKKKSSSSMFNLETLLPILAMTAAPLLAKSFLSPNSINAPNQQREVDKTQGELTHGSDQGTHQATSTT